MTDADKDSRRRVALRPWPEAETNLLVVEDGDLQVRFADAAAWTILDAHWRGRTVAQHSGATGSVFQWETDEPEQAHQTLGTGHGGEIVRQLTARVDERNVPIVADGKLVGEADKEIDGRRVRVVKASTIGPFDHEAIFDFLPAQPGFAVTHRYLANDAMARGRFAGYRYTFMFMLPETYDRYLLANADGSTEQAAIVPEPAMLLNRSFQALACYSPAERTGVAYVFPKAYPGVNHLNVRPGKDRKFRANLFRDHYDVGDTCAFHLRVVPFAAQETDWAEAAAGLFDEAAQ